MAFRADRGAPDHHVFMERSEVELHLDHCAPGDAVDPGLAVVDVARVALFNRPRKNIEHLRLPMAQTGHGTLVDHLGVENVSLHAMALLALLRWYPRPHRLARYRIDTFRQSQ